MRIYYLGDRNVLHEYAYTSSTGWQLGSLQSLLIILNPTSSIAAFRDDGSISVFYQGQCHDLLYKEYIK